MRTIVHLSDLHFGKIDEATLEPLAKLVHQIAPDVLVVSGDLTQRAKSEQFEQARAYLDTLPGPQIIVPGNHDISLYNVFRRFLAPLDRYKRHITEDLSPCYVDDEIAVIGVNTARSLTFKDGRVNKEQVTEIKRQLSGIDRDLTRIVVTHHPFDLPETADESDLVDRAPMAMRAFADCGVDILLSGHMHTSHAKSTAARYEFDEYAALVIQAGTATSTRGRGEVNSFNVVRVDGLKVELERYGWDILGQRFAPIKVETFYRSGEMWELHNSGMMAAGI
jgi:3',5'-cyclic AMP phosphodiesterase CpdA